MRAAVTPAVLTAAVAAGGRWLGTLAQSVSGIGFALVCGPLLVAALGPQDGVRLAVLLSLRAQRRAARPAVAAASTCARRCCCSCPAALATPVLAVAGAAPARAGGRGRGRGRVVLGVAVLASGLRWHAARGRRRRGRRRRARRARRTSLAGVAGPVVALWAANAEWPQRVQRASLQAFFLGAQLVALPSLGLPRVGAGLLAGCLAALAAGAVLGAPLARRVARRPPAARPWRWPAPAAPSCWCVRCWARGRRGRAAGRR